MSETISFTPDLKPEDPVAAFWLRQVMLRLRRELAWCWHERGHLAGGGDPGAGAIPPFEDKLAAALGVGRRSDDKIAFFESDPTARYLTDLLRARCEEPADPARGSFAWVRRELRLDDAASFALALGLSRYFDSAVGPVISACLNDPGRQAPSLALAQRLWDRPAQMFPVVDFSHPLFAFGLLRRGHPAEPEIEAPLSVSPWVAQKLIFPSAPAPRALVRVEPRRPARGKLAPAAVLAARMRDGGQGGLQVVPVLGGSGASFDDSIRELADTCGSEIARYTGDPEALAEPAQFGALATWSWLAGTALYLGPGCAVALAGERGQGRGWLPPRSIPATLIIAAERGRDAFLAEIPPESRLPALQVPSLSHEERVEAWNRALGAKGRAVGEAVGECARRFRFERGTIEQVAGGLLKMRRKLAAEDLVAACRLELRLDFGSLVQEIRPRFGGREELVLPRRQAEQFAEIVRAMTSLTRVHYEWGTAGPWNESGISVLFAGLPGTGKTMAAEILAAELKLPAYRVDLSQVVNKYIGETEKNLRRIFDAADASDCILFFDEADAIFGRRTEVKDSHDRYANLEVSFLLERMERFKGLAILATNRKNDLDEAFLRRLRFVVEFPMPDVGERARIWRQSVPAGVDASAVDFDFLARQFALSGGHVRSIVFNACLQAAAKRSVRALDMEDVLRSVRRELEKANRSVSIKGAGIYGQIMDRIENELAH